MQRSVETSKIMQQRAVITKDRIDEIKWAYQSKNFSVLAETTMKDERTTAVGLIFDLFFEKSKLFDLFKGLKSTTRDLPRFLSTYSLPQRYQFSAH